MNEQNAPQHFEVPNTLKVPCDLNIAEVQLILEYLGDGPHKKVGVLVQRLQSQAHQAVLNLVNPPPQTGPATPPKPDPAPRVGENAAQGKVAPDKPLPIEWYSDNLDEAREHLNAAERVRRSKDGTLDVTPQLHEPVGEDYAAATVLIGLGQQHLDEALPNGQMERVRHAYSALEYGVFALGKFIARRLLSAE